MEFRLFGEVEVLAAGRSLDVGTPRQQAVLAALLVDAGRPVAIGTIVDRVWGESPPAEARNILYSHLSRIRHLLKQDTGGPDPRVERRHAGYVLIVDADLVDLLRFTRLIDRGMTPERADAERVRLLAEALGLWRGTPLAAVPGAWADQVRDSLHRRRLDASVEWARAQLRLGAGTHAVTTALPDLIAEYPLAEPLECVLMEALHAAGRDAEAIDRYTALRQRLADELGTDPGAELQAVHRAILRGELTRPAPPAAPGRAVPDRAVPDRAVVDRAVVDPTVVDRAPAVGRPGGPPAQLPPDVAGFSGRESELRRLDDLLDPSEPRAGTVIVAIDGTAGVGKTALAVHWAHRVADRFPDGQLYVNLQGFDPSGTPLAPAEAVRRFLVAFDVPVDRIPPDFEAQVGMYRSLLARQRVLVVLDNAHDAAQVRPLLPGSRGCVTVVTSRNELTGLVAGTGAQPFALDLPSAAEARDLLTRRLGAPRVAADPQAVDELIGLCARLPLALAIVAARAAARPGFGLAVLAGELRQARGGLDEFAGADPATDPRVVFSWSYRQLSPAAARLFRLLGLHPGPDFTAPAAASLAALSRVQARPLLAELTHAHLLGEYLPGRYTCHDLLRAYGSEQARAQEPDAGRQVAVERMFSHYTHSADSADRQLNPHRDGPGTPPDGPAGVAAEYFTDRGHALAWLHAEHPVLLSLIRQVPHVDAQVCQLAWTLGRFLAYQGHWHNAIGVLETAAEAAGRLADQRSQAYAHRMLGCACIRLGRFESAHVHLQDALDRFQRAGDPVGEAHTRRHYSWLLERQGRYPEAITYAERAFELFRVADHRFGQGRALNAIGWYHALLDDHPAAIGYCQRALTLQRDVGDRYGQAETWDSLGYAQHRLGRYDEAVTCYETAAELYRHFDDRYNVADTMASLGDVHRAAGDLVAARVAWERALAVLITVNHRDAERIRARLDELGDRVGVGG